MRLLVALCLVGVVLCHPRPAFRYAYLIPQAEQEKPWSQFNERGDDHYAWGYDYPGRVHFESNDNQGRVRGSFGYVDANGNPVVWQYTSDPNAGFQVKTGISPALSPAPVAGGEAVSLPEPSLYFGGNKEPSVPYTRAQLVEDTIGPLLKQAVSVGVLVPAGSSPSDTPQYAINPEAAQRIGGVSAVAEALGAIPVAAVHDVQSRPSSAASYAFAPVLNHREEPDITLYTLEVPIQ